MKADRMKSLKDLSPTELMRLSQLLAAGLDALFWNAAVKDARFALLFFRADAGGADEAHYPSNCQRADVVAAFQATADALEAHADQVVAAFPDDPQPAAPTPEADGAAP